MKNHPQALSSQTQQSKRALHVATRLDQCAETLRIPEVCAVLQISPAQYFKLKAHHTFPIQPLDGLGGAVRYSKAAVERYINSQAAARGFRAGGVTS